MLLFTGIALATSTTSSATSHVIIYAFDQNPAGSDDGNEWVTFHNPSNKSEDIGNWTFESTHGTTAIDWIPEGTTLYPGAYCTYTPFYRWLDNSEEAIILRNAKGEEIDRTPVLSDNENDNRYWIRNNSEWTFGVKELEKGELWSGYVKNVVDGDTVDVRFNIYGIQRVRLVGINTPEIGEEGYEEAKEFVNKTCLGEAVKLDVDDREQYDPHYRILAVVYLNDTNLNEKLVKEGYAEVMYIPPSEFPAPVLSTWYSIYFVPDDKCEQYMVELINSANSSVYAALYDIKLNNVSDALIDAYENRSIDVKVVTDDKCANHAGSMYPKLAKLDIIKTDFKTSDFMHNKFIAIDNRTVWTGSMNPTPNGAYYNNNNVIVISSTELASDYITEFFEMWDGSFSKGSPANTPYPIVYVNGTKIECYFAPEDGVEDQIVDELKDANNSVYFAIFTFTSKPIAETLIDLHNQGVKVKGIYEKRQNSTWCTYQMLRDAGIEVIWDKNPKTMHHKFFIIDKATTITGSYNPTKHANTANDENILIIHNENVSNEYVREFYEMWNEWRLITLRSLSNLSTTSCVSFDLVVAFYGLRVYGLYSLRSKDKEKIYEN